MNGTFKYLSDRTKCITKFLREAFYSDSSPTLNPLTCPLGGAGKGASGPWPDFVFSTYACAKSEQGFCSPCFYSRLPKSLAERTQIMQALLTQLNFVLDNFEELVMKTQTRLKPFPGFRTNVPDGRNAIMSIGSNGSFWGDSELPRGYRRDILEKMTDITKTNRVNLLLYIQTRAEDVIRAYQDGELNELAPLLSRLNVIFLFGFESRDEFARNVLYNKGLSLEDFELAVQIGKKFGVGVSAFVFLGLHSMTQIESIEDTSQTFAFLRKIGVAPTLQISKLQPYTLNHLLFCYNRYNLPDARTVAQAVSTMFSFEIDDYVMDPWLIADPLEGNPDFGTNICNSPNSLSCVRCSTAIVDAIYQVRTDYNSERFRQSLRLLENCGCRSRYVYAIDSERRLPPLEVRAEANIAFAEGKKEEYVRELKKQAFSG